MIKILGVSVSVQNYFEIEDHEQIHEEQEALTEAEAEPAEVESDEDQALVSAKEALKCCLHLPMYFVRSYKDTRIVQSRCHQVFARTGTLERNRST